MMEVVKGRKRVFMMEVSQGRKRPFLVEVNQGQEATIDDGSWSRPGRDHSWWKLVKARKNCSWWKLVKGRISQGKEELFMA